MSGWSGKPHCALLFVEAGCPYIVQAGLKLTGRHHHAQRPLCSWQHCVEKPFPKRVCGGVKEEPMKESAVICFLFSLICV